jgi:hypothetical protein
MSGDLNSRDFDKKCYIFSTIKRDDVKDYKSSKN